MQKRSLEYFQNRIVTFFVQAINRNFDEKQAIDYFVGKITKFDEIGIWYEHPVSKCNNFIFYDKIISISEEELVEQQMPEQLDNLAKEEMNKQLSELDPENLTIEVQDSQPVLETVEDFRKFIS